MLHCLDSYSKMTSRTKKVWIDNMDWDLLRLKSESEKKNDEKMVTKSREAERNYGRKTFVFELEMMLDTSGLTEATVNNKVEAVIKKGICSASVGERERERERERKRKGEQERAAVKLFFFF